MSNAVLRSAGERVRRPLASLSLTALGALSLIVWTLIIFTTVKYVLLAMRVDNDGEGAAWP